jgi:hypothetical protein
MKYEVPAGVSAAGLAAVEPHLAAAVGVGIGIFGLARRLRGGRRAQRATSPTAYLLEVEKQLSPESALERAGRMLRLVSGASRR